MIANFQTRNGFAEACHGKCHCEVGTQIDTVNNRSDIAAATKIFLIARRWLRIAIHRMQTRGPGRKLQTSLEVSVISTSHLHAGFMKTIQIYTSRLIARGERYLYEHHRDRTCRTDRKLRLKKIHTCPFQRRLNEFAMKTRTGIGLFNEFVGY